MKLLDLYCKAGGAGMGYHRAGFEVVGVDIAPQRHYPFKFVQADAIEYVSQYGWMFDAIHASPPCQAFSRLTPTTHKKNHPDLIAPTREALKRVGAPYVIENVADAVTALINPVMLCGSMFGLKVFRHRYFECSWNLMFSPATCRHDFTPVVISGSPRRTTGRLEYPAQACREASGLYWMTRKEMDEAIPPAYTEWIGRELMKVCQSEKV